MRKLRDIDKEHRRKLLYKFVSKGMSRKDMAAAFGVTVPCVGNWLRAEGLCDPERVASGKKGHETVKKKVS